MLWLKQSTAVTFQLGPFVDIGDGVTPETGLATNMDNATTGIRVSKNGGASADRNSSTAPSHDDDGYYLVELSTTDTNALGTLHVQYEEAAVALPAWKDFMVVAANVWDTFFGADVLQSDMVEILGGAVPATNTTGIPDVNVQEMLDVAVTLTGNDLDVHVAAVLSAAADTIARKVLPQINQPYNDIQILMVDDTDHVTPETGLSLTVTRAINSGTFQTATGTVNQMALGFYQFDASAADMNGAVITFRFVGTGADDTFITIRTAA